MALRRALHWPRPAHHFLAGGRRSQLRVASGDGVRRPLRFDDDAPGPDGSTGDLERDFADIVANLRGEAGGPGRTLDAHGADRVADGAVFERTAGVVTSMAEAAPAPVVKRRRREATRRIRRAGAAAAEGEQAAALDAIADGRGAATPEAPQRAGDRYRWGQLTGGVTRVREQLDGLSGALRDVQRLTVEAAGRPQDPSGPEAAGAYADNDEVFAARFSHQRQPGGGTPVTPPAPSSLRDQLHERLLELSAQRRADARDATHLPRRGRGVALLEADAEAAADPLLEASPLDIFAPDALAVAAPTGEAAVAQALGDVPEMSPADAAGLRLHGAAAAEPGRRGLPDDDDDAARRGLVTLVRAVQRAGLASRQRAFDLVATGQVRLGTAVERDPFRLVGPTDDIFCEGHSGRLRFAAPRLFLFHKPSNVLVGNKDDQGRTLWTKYAAAAGHAHLVPVGSLPFRAHGALLLTNDGDLARFLEHPSAGIQSTYKFRVSPAIDAALAHQWSAEGVVINGVRHRGYEFQTVPGQRHAIIVKARPGICGPEDLGAAQHQRGVGTAARRRHGRDAADALVPVPQLLQALGRRLVRGGRVSFGPYVLHRLAPGGMKEVSIPPVFVERAGAVWRPWVERDWPFFRRIRVERLRRLARHRNLTDRERAELDAFTAAGLQEALAFDSEEIAAEARLVADELNDGPPVIDLPDLPPPTEGDGTSLRF